VLFVSHNMVAVRGLCTRALLLERGSVALDGPVDRAITTYLAAASSNAGRSAWTYRHRGDRFSVDAVELRVNGTSTREIQSGQAATLRVHYTAQQEAEAAPTRTRELSLSLVLFREGQNVTNLWTNYKDGRGVRVADQGYIDCHIPRWPFRAAEFSVTAYMHVGAAVQDWIEDCLVFQSHDGDYFDSGIITQEGQGLVFIDHRWSGHAGL
jgi:lipopolysaccharide transport system ATP-binding protein